MTAPPLKKKNKTLTVAHLSLVLAIVVAIVAAASSSSRKDDLLYLCPRPIDSTGRFVISFLSRCIFFKKQFTLANETQLEQLFSSCALRASRV